MQYSRIVSGFLFLYLAAPFQALFAASLTDSILETPQGTSFILRYELEVPANRDYIVLGVDELNETFNELNKTYNDNEGRHFSRYHYADYFHHWQTNVDQSYRACLERHRVFYHDRPYDSDQNVIIKQGHGNTNVIINNSEYSSSTYGSYIGHNHCVQPEHSVAVLLLDTEDVGAGIFREGYQFEVTKVRYNRDGIFHTVTLYFDHDVARGIRIVSTQSPEDIKLFQLSYREPGDGFWSEVATALASLNALAEDFFEIHLPSARYYD